jgi:rubrerythrin
MIGRLQKFNRITDETIMGKTTEVLDFEDNGLSGVAVVPARNRLSVNCLSEAEIDREVENIKADLDRVAKQMKKALAKRDGKLLFGEEKKVCPECGHVFQGNGWDGIDAHWRAKHEDVMPYEEAWPLLRTCSYGKKNPD